LRNNRSISSASRCSGQFSYGSDIVVLGDRVIASLGNEMRRKRPSFLNSQVIGGPTFTATTCWTNMRSANSRVRKECSSMTTLRQFVAALERTTLANGLSSRTSPLAVRTKGILDSRSNVSVLHRFQRRRTITGVMVVVLRGFTGKPVDSERRDRDNSSPLRATILGAFLPR